MIARVWAARATAANAKAYQRHVEQHLVPELRTIAGYVGITVLTHHDLVSDDVEIIVSTRWISLDAIRRFAGDDLERAVVAAEAKAVLTDWDERVRHYEIVVDDSH
jgi:heme-degrading monooxygenase HmoA